MRCNSNDVSPCFMSCVPGQLHEGGPDDCHRQCSESGHVLGCQNIENEIFALVKRRRYVIEVWVERSVCVTCRLSQILTGHRCFGCCNTCRDVVYSRAPFHLLLCNTVGGAIVSCPRADRGDSRKYLSYEVRQ